MQYINNFSRQSGSNNGIAHPVLASPFLNPVVSWQQEALPLTSNTIKSIEAAGISHTGFVRTKNEDCFFLKTQPTEQNQAGEDPMLQGIFVLCDGMGGFEQGDVASSMATFKLAQDLLMHGAPEFTAEISLKSSIYKVNKDIYQENLQLRQLGLGMMGTTAVAAVLQNQTMSVVHVGDSRCYRITKSRGLEQLTTDHERGQIRISKGLSAAEAYAHPEAFYLTQALGPSPNHMIAPDVSQISIEEDSLFLLCSDGLSDNQVIESYWQSHITPYLSPQKSINDGLQQLLNLGLQKNGHDNITILLVRVCLNEP